MYYVQPSEKFFSPCCLINPRHPGGIGVSSLSFDAMINQYFGYWQVLSKAPHEIGDLQHQYVLARCVCMRKNYVRVDDLKAGKSKSCGCGKSRELLKVVGTTHNRWTILELGPVINTHRYAKCRCSCGYTSLLRLTSVLRGHSKSCGCYKVEQTTNYFRSLKAQNDLSSKAIKRPQHCGDNGKLSDCTDHTHLHP